MTSYVSSLSSIRSPRRNWPRGVISFLFIVVATLLLVEGVLALDPLGFVAYTEIDRTFAESKAIPSGWQMTPGAHQFRHWSATVLEDHARYTPDTGSGETWAFVGDSVTFGYGVNDDETFVNQIARETGIHAINAGSIGYNSANVRARIDDFPDADRVLWMVVDNDAEPTRRFRQTDAPHGRAYLSLYLSYAPIFTQSRSQAFAAQYRGNVELTRFREDVNAITADPRVVLVSFDRNFLLEHLRDYPVLAIPAPSQLISVVDSHPNAAGHRKIATDILSVLVD